MARDDVLWDWIGSVLMAGLTLHSTPDLFGHQPSDELSQRPAGYADDDKILQFNE